MTQPRRISTSAMCPRLALAAVLPPRPRRPAVGVVDRGDERVEQARIVAATVERAEALEELLGVAAAQVLDAGDVEALELARNRRADVRDFGESARHGRNRRGSGCGASWRKRPCAREVGSTACRGER